MEKDIVPKKGYPLELIRARGFEKGFSFETLEAAKGIFDSFIDAQKVLKKYKPDLVIGTGGFTSAMLLSLASLKKIPTMIHEQNAYPGRSNRLTGRMVDRVGLGFLQAQDYFNENKVFLAGNPIRQEFKNLNRQEARKKLGLSEENKMIIIMGGSQGAQSVNNAVSEMINRLKDDPNIIFYFLTGRDQEEKIKEIFKEDKIGNVRIFGYYEDIPTLMAAGDLIISRSGASSVAEIAASEIPSILIPYPDAAGDHQTYNAKVLSENGAAVLIKDEELDGDILLKNVTEILDNDDLRKAMSEKAAEQKILNADDRFCREAFELVWKYKTKKESAS